MTFSNQKGSIDLSSTRLENVLLFVAGGMYFGVEASLIANITDRDWTPPEGGERFDLSELLGRSSSQGARTLVICLSQHFYGFTVDSIFSQGISNLAIYPISTLLCKWLKPSLIKGFCSNNHRLIGVLDLKGLAEYALHSQEHRASKTKDDMQ